MIIGFLLVGLLAGVMSGMFGIGGGIVIVPALTLLIGLSLVSSVATSLAALLLPVGFFAAREYYRKGLLDVRAALWIALGLAITSFVGASIALALPAQTFQQAYGVFLLVMGARFLEVMTLLRGQAPAAPTQPTSTPPHPPIWKVLALGLAAGVLSGMFGIGGGIVIVPALVLLMGYDQRTAVGTSLGALLLPVGLPGVLNYAAANQIALQAVLPVAVGLAIGALGGARLALNLSPHTVKRLYGAFLMLIGLWFIVRPWLGF
jgi:uncharacterized membrane protein YfcA